MSALFCPSTPLSPCHSWQGPFKFDADGVDGKIGLDLKATAWTDDGEIMGVRHTELDIQGVQFHPESILTEHGHAMLKNFL